MSKARGPAPTTDSRLRHNAYTARTVYTRYRGVGASIDGVNAKRSSKAPISQSTKPATPVLRSDASKPLEVSQQKLIAHKIADIKTPTPQQKNISQHRLRQKNINQHRLPKKSVANSLSVPRSEVAAVQAHEAEGSLEKLNQPASFFGRISFQFSQNKPYYSSLMAAAIVFVFGVGVSIHTYLMNQQVQRQVSTVLSASSDQDDSNQLTPGALPDESDQDDDTVRNHQVAPDKPRYLRIPKIGVDHRVIEVGVTDNNQLGAPASIHDVGWYIGSSKPGQSGATLMDGHVSGPTQPGVFRNLIKLNPGDRIEVERGDGEIIEYEVKSKQSYPYAETDMQAALRSVENDKHGLNLITCDGKFNAETNNYEDRLIVFAVEV